MHPLDLLIIIYAYPTAYQIVKLAIGSLFVWKIFYLIFSIRYKNRELLLYVSEVWTNLICIKIEPDKVIV